MCFSIPYEVVDVTKKYAIIEGGKKVLLGKDIVVNKGDFIQVLGNMAVAKLSKVQGKKMQKVLYDLQKNYETTT